MDEIGRNARAISRKLDSFREKGSLHSWVDLASGGRLSVQRGVDIKSLLPSELQADKNDNLIIALALYIKSNQSIDPIVVSKDINVRVKCDALGIKAQDYYKLRAADQAENLYTGVAVMNVGDEVIASLYSRNGLELNQLPRSTYPNQVVILRGSSDNDIYVRHINGRYKLVKDYKNIFGLNPRNKEQNFALELLFDESVKLVTLSGAAGCGKTIIALAAGLQQTVGPNAPYNKLVVTRPIEPLGRDLGYLPGTLEEKMAPWIAPIRDNLEFLLGGKEKDKDIVSSKKFEKDFKGGSGDAKDFKKDPYFDMLFRAGKIEIEAVTYIRGRSIPNSYIIIDEAQNLTPHQLKTIITRTGEGTKIVLSGDVQQIDVALMDAVSNGLSYVVEKFKESDIAGHVTFLKGERSNLATLAADIL